MEAAADRLTDGTTSIIPIAVQDFLKEAIAAATIALIISQTFRECCQSNNAICVFGLAWQNIGWVSISLFVRAVWGMHGLILFELQAILYQSYGFGWLKSIGSKGEHSFFLDWNNQPYLRFRWRSY